MRTIQDMVRQEVHLCLSALVYTIAGGYGGTIGRSDLATLTEKAMEVSSPVDDWESAAFEEGWAGPFTDEHGATFFKDESDGQTWACEDWEDLCRDHDIDPHQREVFEHWAVSEWLARKLEAKGERVDRDFENLCVWGRTATGQAIYMDSVIEEIYREAAES